MIRFLKDFLLRLSENSQMKRQEHYVGLTLIISVLLFYILTLFGCAPTQVKIYPKETRTEKTPPGDLPQEKPILKQRRNGNPIKI
jgi:hypothetical protein